LQGLLGRNQARIARELINLDVELAPCRGHFRAWENRVGVTVRVVINEH
jgi:hypothetical protein